MSRRATKPRPRAPHCLITPAIIQGRNNPGHRAEPTIFEANCRRVWLAYGGAGARARVRKLVAARLFATVEGRTSILHELRPARYQIVPYLIELAARSPRWLREPEDFQPCLEHPSLQLLALLRHLFGRYPAPAWLEAALTPRRGPLVCGPELGWFIHVVQGGNLREAPRLPLALTSRAAHFAMAAPAGMRPPQALLFGVLRAIGGRDELVHELLLCSRWLISLDAVWLKLYEKVLRAPEFPAHQLRPLIDYVRHRRFAHERRATFDLNAYTVAELLDGTARWHAELRTAAAARNSGVAFDATWASRLRAKDVSGTSEHGDFTLAELCSADALFDEGSFMHHCVASYTRSCAEGLMSIWSLRYSGSASLRARVTIRVAVTERCVVEARRFANARIDARDLQIISNWAGESGLSVAEGL
jgi:hypothetical protein